MIIKSCKRKFVIQWHITGKCNLRCKHCYMEEYNKDLNKENLIDIFNQINNFFNKYQYKVHINFTGGEPFISPYLFDLLKLCDDNNITYGILTNGTLLNIKILDKLSECKNLKFIQFSLDGVQKTHDFIRGNGSFDKTIESIKLTRKFNIQTMVSFTANKNNYKELNKLISICRKIKVDRFWTDRLIPSGNNILDIMETEDFIKYLKLLDKEKFKYNLLKKLRIKTTQIHTNRALQFTCKNSHEFYVCSAGKSLLTILEDGTLLPCRRLPLEIGNLLNDNIINLYENSEIIKELKDDIIAKGCEKCKHNKHCNGGAKCLTYAVKKEMYLKDINCDITS